MKKKFLSIILTAAISISIFATNSPVTASAVEVNNDKVISEESNENSFTGEVRLTEEEKEKEEQTHKQLKSINDITYDNNLEKSIAEDSTTISSVDNSSTKYFPKVVCQKGGSCSSYGITYYQMTYMQNRFLNRAADKDENICSPRFTYNITNDGSSDNGATPTEVYNILTEIGTPSVADVPIEYTSFPSNYYTSWSAKDNIWEKASNNRIAGYELAYFYTDTSNKTPITSPTDPDLDVVKNLLKNGEILSFGTEFYSFRYEKIAKNSKVPYNDSHVGEYIISRCDAGTGGNHRMCIVGYDDNLWVDINKDGQVQEGEKGAFKIVNSHGDWKNNGFCWISYDTINDVSCVNNANINNTNRRNLSYVNYCYRMKMKDCSSTPKLYAELKLNSKSRNKVKVTLYDEDKNKSYKVYNLNGSCGGNYSFDGYTSNDSGTFIYNLDNVLKGVSSNDLANDTWKVIIEDTKADNNVLKVESFKLIDRDLSKTYSNVYNRTSKKIFDNNVTLDGSSVELAIGKNAEPKDNYTTIYYSGYNNPNIHYQIGNGAWTSVPGVKMESSNEVPGYPYKAKINLGEETKLTACFNDGNGNWDSRNGLNYEFANKCYTFKNGVITEIDDPSQFTISNFYAKKASPQTAGISNTLNIDTSNAKGKVTYSITAIDPNNTSTKLLNNSTNNNVYWTPSVAGTYTLIAEATDESGTTVSKTINFVINKHLTINSVNINPTSSYKVGKPITFDITTTGGTGNKTYELFKGNYYHNYGTLATSTTNKLVWTPTEAGYYFVSIEAKDESGDWNLYSLQISVEENDENTITIYYSGYNNPYAHYQVGDGAWTSVPGVKMNPSTKYAGYPYEITIDLATANKLNLCFNDGNGNWDSNNGNNYTLTKAGEYKYSNGKFTDVNAKNIVTIYYKGYSNPYIHYAIGSGAWTAVPGVPMIATSEKVGYTHKIIIDLGDADKLTACFNDGNGNWDSNYGNNYVFTAGTYTFSNGTINTI